VTLLNIERLRIFEGTRQVGFMLPDSTTSVNTVDLVTLDLAPAQMQYAEVNGQKLTVYYSEALKGAPERYGMQSLALAHGVLLL
jgi:hypothetical protein